MNTVELIGFYGNDETHALSAWTSTSRDLTDEKKQRIPSLLKMLADEGHLTPFEKSSLHFLVTCDQASHIHLLKHRIGVSINGESARYKELKEDKVYFPEDWNINVKDLEGNYYLADYFSETDDDTAPATWNDILKAYAELGNRLYHQCLAELTPTLGRKRAKESARFFKTFNSQITMDVMFNFRSFAHFQTLRNSEHAQLEIKGIAQQMLELVKNIEGQPFKHTIDAFGWS